MSTKTVKFFAKVNMLTYLAGLPNFWIEDINLPDIFIKIHTPLLKINGVATFLFVMFQWASYFTQPNLSEKQQSDRLVFTMSLLILYFYFTFVARKTVKIRYLMRALGVELKKIHNDLNAEREMIRKVKLYCIALINICSSALISYGFIAITQYIKRGATFTTVITAWPDVHDTSTPAHVARIICYVLWWLTMSRVFAAFAIVMLLAISLGLQYRNLCSYFSSLSDIFDNDMTQDEKENEYEKQLKIGIKMHAETLRCVDMIQDACSAVYTGQIVMNTSVLAVVMIQMVESERTIGNVVATIFSALSLLVSTGVFMWSAGDITAEAENLSKAIYMSGWERCFGKTGINTRKLAVLATVQAQRRVVIRGFRVIEMTYENYVKIVKASYSVFSVFY